MGLILCAVVFVGVLILSWRSLVAGLLAVFAVGWVYGILRANLLDLGTYFLFDAATAAIYLSQLIRHSDPDRKRRARPLLIWTCVLCGWALVMALIPMQPMLVQLVGLRGNAWFLPFMMLGAFLTREEARRLALGLAALNLLAFAFAIAEYLTDVTLFFPENDATRIVYLSNDVAGYTAYRIPATFITAGMYGGVMTSTLPWLLGAIFLPRNRRWHVWLLGAGIFAAVLGNFMAATRANIVPCFAILAVTPLVVRMRSEVVLGVIAMVLAIAVIVSGEERMQRFTTLGDTAGTGNRIAGSINVRMLELAEEYPMGVGMGAGGTNLPAFIASQVRVDRSAMMESEISRLLLEVGLPGLALWVAFVFWLAFGPIRRRDEWYPGRRLLWYSTMGSLAGASIGLGLLISIPSTALFFLGIGFMMSESAGGRPDSLRGRRGSVPAKPSETPEPVR